MCPAFYLITLFATYYINFDFGLYYTWRVIAGWTITAVVTCSKSIILITRIFKRRSHKNCVTSFVSINNLEIPVIFGGSGKKKNVTKPQPEVLYKTESK